MKHVKGFFLGDLGELTKNFPPQEEIQAYHDEYGRELILRLYLPMKNWYLATIIARFPEKGIEVEMQYDANNNPTARTFDNKLWQILTKDNEITNLFHLAQDYL